MGKKLTVEVEGVDEIDVADSLRRITESVRSGHSRGEGFKVETVQTENERQLYDAQHVFDFVNDDCDGNGLVVTDLDLLRRTVANHYEVDPEDIDDPEEGDEAVEANPLKEAADAYQDKHWVADQVIRLLKKSTDPAAAYLLPRFKWLLRVWNTDRDFAYPSLEEYDPAKDGDDEKEVETGE